jgi:NADH:ubiquinone oxidoreductase subunit 4 (subunit M)
LEDLNVTIAIFLPLAFCIVAIWQPRRNTNAIDVIAKTGIILSLGYVFITMFRLYGYNIPIEEFSQTRIFQSEHRAWMGTFGPEYFVAFRPLSILFLAIYQISIVITVFSNQGFLKDKNRAIGTLLTLFSSSGIFLSLDLFLVFIFLSVNVVATFVLLSTDHQLSEARAKGFFLSQFSATLMLLAGVIILARQSSANSFNVIEILSNPGKLNVFSPDSFSSTFAFLLIFLAILGRFPLFPFFSLWFGYIKECHTTIRFIITGTWISTGTFLLVTLAAPIIRESSFPHPWVFPALGTVSTVFLAIRSLQHKDTYNRFMYVSFAFLSFVFCAILSPEDSLVRVSFFTFIHLSIALAIFSSYSHHPSRESLVSWVKIILSLSLLGLPAFPALHTYYNLFQSDLLTSPAWMTGFLVAMISLAAASSSLAYDMIKSSTSVSSSSRLTLNAGTALIAAGIGLIILVGLFPGVARFLLVLA